ncbi:hypothetical protein N9O83_02770 [Flavobacteriales bacterium]|nr:hypothetical protein [Flavobacteriales bacterium]
MNKTLVFIFLAVITKESFASFPILTNEIEDFAVGNLTYQNPWYISAKNAILFLAFSIFGLGVFSVFIDEGFVVNDYEGPKVLLILPLLIASIALYTAVFFGKKIFGNSVKNVDRLSKKIVFWTLLISVFLSLLIGFSGMGSGMGG